MFDMMIDTGAKSYHPVVPYMTLRWKLYVKNASDRKSAIQENCPVRRQVLLYWGLLILGCFDQGIVGSFLSGPLQIWPFWYQADFTANPQKYQTSLETTQFHVHVL